MDPGAGDFPPLRELFMPQNSTATAEKQSAEIIPLHRKQVEKPLRICLLGYRSHPYGGGQGIYIKYLSKALVDAGHEVDVISGEPYPHLDERVRLIKMPGLNGLEATLRIQHAHAHVHVVVLSMYSTQEHVYQALHAGASGFVAKEEAWEELATAIRTVCADKIYLSPTIRREDIQEYIRRAQADQELDSFESLTPREREVLQLIAEEHNTREIGALLSISPKTVESHRSHLMNKLGIHTTAGLTRYAISRGVVDLPERYPEHK